MNNHNHHQQYDGINTTSDSQDHPPTSGSSDSIMEAAVKVLAITKAEQAQQQQMQL